MALTENRNQDLFYCMRLALNYAAQLSSCVRNQFVCRTERRFSTRGGDLRLHSCVVLS